MNVVRVGEKHTPLVDEHLQLDFPKQQHMKSPLHCNHRHSFVILEQVLSSLLLTRISKTLAPMVAELRQACGGI